jgi:methionyl-tRNA synthetase
MAIAMEPYLPETAEKVWNALGMGEDIHRVAWDKAREPVFSGGEQISAPIMLFKKLEDKTISALKKKYSGTKQVATKEERAMIQYDDFAKCDFRVGYVESVERVEGSKKLLKLIVDIGDEKRQLVAGLAEFYAPEEMQGKKIVMIANLEPAKLFGIESQGMLLAAEKGDTVSLLTVDEDIEPGAKVR